MAENTVILTGFMGMGKSTVGRRAAELLGVDYYDTDSWMETESGIDEPALVKTDMAAFRKLEADTLREILAAKEGIVSTGGGIVSTQLGRGVLLGSGVPAVWLQAPFEVAAQRVAQDRGRERPLFANIDTARALFNERQPWYKETATAVVDASRPVELVAGDIVSILRSR